MSKMSNEKETFVLPPTHAWIDEKFLKKVLQRSKDDWTLRVKTFDIEPGSKAGDNYAGVVYKVNVTTEDNGETKTHSLFVKCLPVAEMARKMFLEQKVQAREINFYKVAVPEVNNFLQKRCKTVNILQYFPKCIYGFINGKTDPLVMENLREFGFRMANRKAGLDYNHCKLAIRGLAQFHAATYAFREKEPETFKTFIESFKENMYTKQNKNLMAPMTAGAVQNVAKVCAEIRQCEHLTEKIEALKDKAFDILEELLQPKEPNAVLCFGDCWVNNMLFKYKSSSDAGEEVPEAIKFLDFQICRYSSPALDLIYFLYTSTTGKLRKEHLKDLQILYCDTFAEVLNAVGVDSQKFNLEVLQNEWKDHVLYGLIFGSMALGAVTADENDVPNFGSMEEGDFGNTEKMQENMSSFYKTSLYKERLGVLLKEFESFGVFD